LKWFEICKFEAEINQMKIQTILLILLLFTFNCFGQSKIQWEYSYDSESESVYFTAKIADGWHLYSQHISNEIGPVPTSFFFEKNSSYKLIGEVNEPKPIQKYDQTFEAMLDFFVGKVVFQQRIAAKKDIVVNGSVTYMLCNDTMCLPPNEEKFAIYITK
jgi:thiol:disulfide interchange protein DsbD